MLHKNRVKNRTHMTSFRVIIISFFCLILVGYVASDAADLIKAAVCDFIP